jgi:hypothetical protein
MVSRHGYNSEFSINSFNSPSQYFLIQKYSLNKSSSTTVKICDNHFIEIRHLLPTHLVHRLKRSKK